MRVVAMIAAASLSTLATSPAWAKAPPSVRLEYSRAPGAAQACPDEAAVRRAVAALLAFDPFREPAELVVHATLNSAEGGLAARLEVTTSSNEARGSRQISSQAGDCTELASAMELAISIAINPFLLMPKHPEQPAPPPPAKPPAPRPSPAMKHPAPSATPAPARAPEPRPEPPAPAAASSRFDLEAQLSLVASLGTAPDFSFGGGLGIAVRYSRFQLGIEGRADLPASKAINGGKMDAALFTGSLVPCVRLGMVGLCVVASGGAVRASTGGLPGSRVAWGPYSGVGARAFVDLPINGPLSLRVLGEIKAATTRTQITAGATTLWEMSPVSGSFAVALAVHFP